MRSHDHDAPEQNRAAGAAQVILPHIDEPQYRWIMVTATIDRHRKCVDAASRADMFCFAQLAERDPPPERIAHAEVWVTFRLGP